MKRAIVTIVLMSVCAQSIALRAEITRRVFFDQPYPIDVISQDVMDDVSVYYWNAVHHVFEDPSAVCSHSTTITMATCLAISLFAIAI